ncbi:MAG: rhodanese-like domain-containing protein [Candidatus Nanopelagicales bacterium]
MHMRRFAPIALAGALLLTPGLAACGSSTEAAPAPTTSASQPSAPVRLVVPEWMEAAQSPGTVIIDVRTPEEFNSGHVQGALNIPVESPDFAAQVSALDPATTYAIYCRSGNRSAVATAEMGSMGFMHLYDLEGGFSDLEAAGMPTA